MSLTTQELIERLDAWLHQNRLEYYECLQPGLSDEEIRVFEAKLGLELPEDFKLFYGWKNGQAMTNYTRFIDNLRLMSAEHIVASYQNLQEIVQQYDFGENWWRSKWIPFLTDDADNNYCVDLEGSFQGKRNQILSFWNDSEERTILYESFYKWLETVVTAFDKGFVSQDENDIFIQSEAYKAFLKENNPGYPIGNEAG